MLMRFYETIGIPRESMRLLINSMGCEKCRPVYRELVRSYMNEHPAARVRLQERGLRSRNGERSEDFGPSLPGLP